MPMVSMKMSAEEAKDYTSCTMDSKGPEYPYGLCISLNEEALAKLGITELPPVGAAFMIHAHAKVESTSAHSDSAGEEERSMSLQITDLGLEMRSPDAAQSMYPNSNMSS